MKKSDISRNLNSIVEYNGPQCKGDFKLTAGIIRRKPNGEDEYSVELQSLHSNSVMICGLEQVNIKDKGGKEECTI